MRTALIVSVGINLFLAAGIGLARVDVSRSLLSSASDARSVELETSRSAVATVSTLRDLASAGTSLHAYYALLRSAGFGHDDTFVPLSGWSLRALAAGEERRWEYWLAEQPGSDAARERRDTSENALRAELLQLFGPQVAERPEFGWLFRPLGPAFDFMASADQIELQRWRRSHPGDAVGSLSGADDAPGAVRNGGCVAASSLARPERSARTPVPAAFPPQLDDSIRFELGLRLSPLARALRPLALDEQTFREAYGLLEQLLTAPDMTARAGLTAALQTLLGVARSDELMRALDPAAVELERVLNPAGATPGQIQSAYAVIARAREAIVDLLAGGADGAWPGTANQLAAIRQAERDGLTAVLGPELAARVSAAQRFRGGRDGCSPE